MVAGVVVGLVGGAFRWCLGQADSLRTSLIIWARHWPVVGWIIPVVLAIVATALARYLVIRFAPEAGGSGIQRVEAIEAHDVDPGRGAILPVKFLGGLLSLGAGMALGREGPTVQMGASVAHLIAPHVVLNKEDERIVLAAGSGAGLAVAFNAPIGGSTFVFEELTSKFSPWLLLSTLGAATCAILAMRRILGNHFDFFVSPGPIPANSAIWFFVVLGAMLGAAGALYNMLIMRFLRARDSLAKVPSWLYAGLIGGIVGLMGWFSPAVIGGGDGLTQSLLLGQIPLISLGWIFPLRFLLGPLCYSAETPGGMFAPMLLLGSAFGMLFGAAAHSLSLVTTVSTVDFAVVGMAALFAGSVRAPLTGMMLAIELTGRADLTLGMLGAGFGAMLVATLINSEPIYESLLQRMLQNRLKDLKPAPVTSAVEAG